MDFQLLVQTIQQTHQTLRKSAVKSVNIHLTIRNWLVGLHIVEFEQNGLDRAEYGARLLENIAEKIRIKGLSASDLSRCRQFYQIYPILLGVIREELENLPLNSILGSKTQESGTEVLPVQIAENEGIGIFGLLTQKLTQEEREYAKRLIRHISFTHFTELIKIAEPVKRRYYELLIFKVQPSVKELRREISSLSFERLGLSADMPRAFERVINKIEPMEPADAVKSHYFFDFLGIPNKPWIEESDLEQALIEHLQQFMIELGNGFCFEARQKRILIGDEYFFIDLLFYHRVLKCHVLIELKTSHVKHEHIGQLKTYVNYFKKEIQRSDDNPPVGILLVTDQNKTLVEYAMADSDQQLFVSKYQMELPSKEQLAAFIQNELRKS